MAAVQASVQQSLAAITDDEFERFRNLIYEVAGVSLADHKRVLVMSRLWKRVRHWGLANLGAYHDLVIGEDAGEELQLVIDLLTTHETYFFREMAHFSSLQEIASSHSSAEPFRVWSAAASTGEEAYSAAMILSETMGERVWEVFGSDISLSSLRSAAQGCYSMQAARRVPTALLKKHGLRAIGRGDGTWMIKPGLRERVAFGQFNLLSGTPPWRACFDVAFLRNVLIYFDADTRRQVLGNVLAGLKPGGYLFLGHAENIDARDWRLRRIQSAVYRREE